MNKLAFVLILGLAAGVQSLEPIQQERKPLTRAEPERAARAQELLAQTRAALSQSAKLGNIKTLSVSGKVRRSVMSASRSDGNAGAMTMIGGDVDPTILGADTLKEDFLNGQVEYDFLLPDKFRWQDEIELFRRSQRSQRIFFLDGELFGMKINNRLSPPPNPQFASMMQQNLQAQVAPITLGLLVTPPPAFPLEYSYAHEKPFKQGMAEVVTITGPGTFKADLYLDQTTHLPLMLRLIVGGISRPAAVLMPPEASREEGLRALESARQQAMAKPPGQQEREKLILFADYRAVDGVLFPHKITTQINGKLIEEILLAKFKVNQPIKPEKFTERQ